MDREEGLHEIEETVLNYGRGVHDQQVKDRAGQAEANQTGPGKFFYDKSTHLDLENFAAGCLVAAARTI